MKEARTNENPEMLKLFSVKLFKVGDVSYNKFQAAAITTISLEW